MKLKDPKTSVIIRDITNERTRAKFEKLEGDSPITVFFKNLDRKFNNQPNSNEFWFKYRTKLGNQNKGTLIYLFITSSMHSYFLIENPEVLVLDAIYKINRFRMPLVNIIKMIGMNRNFYIISVFLTGEKENNYNIVFSNFKDLYNF